MAADILTMARCEAAAVALRLEQNELTVARRAIGDGLALAAGDDVGRMIALVRPLAAPVPRTSCRLARRTHCSSTASCASARCWSSVRRSNASDVPTRPSPTMRGCRPCRRVPKRAGPRARDRRQPDPRGLRARRRTPERQSGAAAVASRAGRADRAVVSGWRDDPTRASSQIRTVRIEASWRPREFSASSSRRSSAARSSGASWASTDACPRPHGIPTTSICRRSSSRRPGLRSTACAPNRRSAVLPRRIR